MTDLRIKDTLNIESVNAVSRRPRFAVINNGSIGGRVRGPAGVRKIVYTSAHKRQSIDYNVLLPEGTSIPYTSGEWLAVIWDEYGNHIFADGSRGFATIGTPVVRITDNGPSKAVLTLPPVEKYTWSNGTKAPIERGMMLAVSYYDASSRHLRDVFHGIIRQIERGEEVTLTAYDRMMDLADYSDQFQPANAHGEETSWTRAIVGSDYRYTFASSIGTIVSAGGYNLVTADPLAEEDGESTPIYEVVRDKPVTFFMPVPDHIQPASGTPITHVKAKLRVVLVRSSSTTEGYVKVRTTFSLCIGYLSTMYVQSTASVETTVTTEYTEDDKTIYPETDVWWTMPKGSMNPVLIGVTMEIVDDNVGTAIVLPYDSSTRYWVSSDVRYKLEGTVAFTRSYRTEKIERSWQPEIAVTYTVYAGNVAIERILASGTLASVPDTAIPDTSPDYKDDATFTMVSKGVGLRMDYYALGDLQTAKLVNTLIRAAGLESTLEEGADLGNLSYYTTSTFDYLTCIHELIRAANYGLKDTIDYGREGTIQVLPRHTLDEDPVETYSTRPYASWLEGYRAIVSHDLTSHWMAERATQAIIAEDATNNGLPIALETDDERMPNSIALALGTPLRGVSADNSAGSHAMLASAAGGRMIQLHTNVIEGKLTLAGYRLSLWDWSDTGEGGLPIRLDIPEASVKATAIPTEIVIGNGVTQVSLDNVRTADRSEVARSMGLTADGVSNNSQSIASAMYIFGKLLTYDTYWNGTQPADFGGIYLLSATGGLLARQTEPAFLKTTTDAAGYTHYCAIFRKEDHNGAAAATPVAMVGIGSASDTSRIAVLDNPKNILASQVAHIDIRVPNTAPPTS